MNASEVVGALEANVAGETLVALPQKALYWPKQETLFVADVHLGKDATFLAHSIPLPQGATQATLDRLDSLLRLVATKRLVMLGDLWHARAGRTQDLVGRFLDWRHRHADVEMTLVEGNHDLRSGKLPENSQIQEVAEPYVLSPFALSHYPEPSDDGYVLCGHIHPGVVLEGRGRQSMRLPCFWFSESFAVLPAFGEMTGCARISPSSSDSVYAIAGDRVIKPACIS